MGRRTINLYRFISNLPLSPKCKFSVVRAIRQCVRRIRHDDFSLEPPCTLVNSNEAYGHEYWLKQYAGYAGDIYAQIEHGLYFGENTSPKVNTLYTDWQIGSTITYGPYRKRCMEEAYPGMAVHMVGPYIQYVLPDEEYYRYILSEIDCAKKTIALFPAHSVVNSTPVFDLDAFVDDCRGFANKQGIENVLLCMNPNDYIHGMEETWKRRGVLLVSSGMSTRSFLPRQRAILMVADVVASNAVGTHIGYALSVGTPHVFIDPIVDESKISMDSHANVLAARKEREAIYSAFSLSKFDGSITADQKDLFDWFWGGDIRLSPAEMAEVFEECRRHYETFGHSFV